MPKESSSQQGQDTSRASADLDDQAHREALTCSVLCSLMKSSRSNPPYVPSSNMISCDRDSMTSENDQCDYDSVVASNDKRRSNDTCTDHLQLPMFLSSK